MTRNAFLAADLTTDERHALSAALRDASPGPRVPGKRVHPDNWHLTLRFLGPADEVPIDRVARELDRTLDAPGGRVRCTGLGAFPRSSKATIVYIAIDDPEDLLGAIAGQCEESCRNAGLEPEERPFVPHITLARVRPPQDVRRLFGTFGDFSVPVRIRAVTLFVSEAEGRGVRYRAIETFPLGGNPVA